VWCIVLAAWESTALPNWRERCALRTVCRSWSEIVMDLPGLARHEWRWLPPEVAEAVLRKRRGVGVWHELTHSAHHLLMRGAIARIEVCLDPTRVRDGIVHLRARFALFDARTVETALASMATLRSIELVSGCTVSPEDVAVLSSSLPLLERLTFGCGCAVDSAEEFRNSSAEEGMDEEEEDKDDTDADTDTDDGDGAFALRPIALSVSELSLPALKAVRRRLRKLAVSFGEGEGSAFRMDSPFARPLLAAVRRSAATLERLDLLAAVVHAEVVERLIDGSEALSRLRVCMPFGAVRWADRKPHELGCVRAICAAWGTSKSSARAPLTRLDLVGFQCLRGDEPELVELGTLRSLRRFEAVMPASASYDFALPLVRSGTDRIRLCCRGLCSDALSGTLRGLSGVTALDLDCCGSAFPGTAMRSGLSQLTSLRSLRIEGKGVDPESVLRLPSLTRLSLRVEDEGDARRWASSAASSSSLVRMCMRGPTSLVGWERLSEIAPALRRLHVPYARGEAGAEGGRELLRAMQHLCEMRLGGEDGTCLCA